MTIDFDSNKIPSRQEREERVLDLHFNQNRNYRQIARDMKMSVRDIGEIVNRAKQEKERQGHKSTAVQAYEHFSKGKTPLEVAIILNIGEAHVIAYYGQYLKLVQLDDITKIYQELGSGIWDFEKLCKEAKAAKMGVRHVVNLIRIANNYLPSVEHRYGQLQRQNNYFDSILKTKGKEFQNLTDHITHMSKRLDYIKSEYESKAAIVQHLNQQAAKLKAFVNNFKNNDPEYVKLRKTIEEEIIRILSDNRALLKLAVLSIAESVRNNPDKYNYLVSNYNPPSSRSSTDNSCQYMYQPWQADGQQSEQLQQQPYLRIKMLIDEANKLYTFLAERFLCDIVNENVSNQSIPAAALPAAALPSKDVAVGGAPDDDKLEQN
jgi:hypothetical protein